jgi:hypothetical protein
MSRFWQDAVQILETASHAPHDAFSADMAVIVDSSGGLRIVSSAGWSIEGLRSEYGGAVYQVRRSDRDVYVKGSAPGMHCVLSGPLAIPRLPQTPRTVTPQNQKLLA